jgi:hypothetical protein
MKRRKKDASDAVSHRSPTATPAEATVDGDRQLTLRETAALMGLPMIAVKAYAERGELRGERGVSGWRFTSKAVTEFWQPCPDWDFDPVSSED